MTDNTQELDEILDSFFTVGTERKISELKQAILDWHNKQIEAYHNEANLLKALEEL